MCHYPDDHKSNEKFLCKGDDPFHCEDLIKTTEENKVVSNGRFSIRDNRRLMHFSVNIQNLGRVDSGTYWCGSDRKWQHDRFNKTLLTVGEYDDSSCQCNSLHVTASLQFFLSRTKCVQSKNRGGKLSKTSFLNLKHLHALMISCMSFVSSI